MLHQLTVKLSGDVRGKSYFYVKRKARQWEATFRRVLPLETVRGRQTLLHPTQTHGESVNSQKAPTLPTFIEYVINIHNYAMGIKKYSCSRDT